MSDLKDMSTEMYRQWEQSMSKWWDSLLDNPQFIRGMGDNLAAQSRVRKTYEDQVDESMKQMHLPSRKDVVRVARIASLLEDKVLGLEDALLDQHDAIRRIERDALQARVDTAETLVAVQDRLDTIEAKLDALLAKLGAEEAQVDATAPAPRGRGRRGAKASEQEG